MQAKRTPARTAKPARPRPTKRAEACRVLQVAPTADDDLITQAYWHLARKHWANAGFDPEARKRLEEVNKAYVVLNPNQPVPPLSLELPPLRDEPPLVREFAVWFRRLVEQTKARWLGRVPEIATLTVTTAILAFLALAAGAEMLWTLVVTVAALVTVWAPWRRL
jgi:hypothetical protein